LGEKSISQKNDWYILSLEGADSIVTLKHLERAYNDGASVRGPAHYGPGRYAQAQMQPGGSEMQDERC